MFRLLLLLLFFSFFLLCTSVTEAQLKMPAVLSHNIVLQRNNPLPVWGKVLPGCTVTVSFLTQQITIVIEKVRNSLVTLHPLVLSATATDLKIKRNEIIGFQNILPGDGWFCSGNSNMGYPLNIKSKKYAAPVMGKFVPATAVIKNNKAELFSAKKIPKYISFVCYETVQPNLFNKDGLFAWPICTNRFNN